MSEKDNIRGCASIVFKKNINLDFTEKNLKFLETNSINTNQFKSVLRNLNNLGNIYQQYNFFI